MIRTQELAIRIISKAGPLANLATRFPSQQCQTIFTLCKDQTTLEATSVNRFMDLFAIA